MRRSASPEDDLMMFLESTYSAAADLARWDRSALERAPGRGAAASGYVSRSVA
jgi:Family of unknown function (DUF5996)